jgi:hypothetical protein
MRERPGSGGREVRRRREPVAARRFIPLSNPGEPVAGRRFIPLSNPGEPVAGRRFIPLSNPGEPVAGRRFIPLSNPGELVGERPSLELDKQHKRTISDPRGRFARSERANQLWNLPSRERPLILPPELMRDLKERSASTCAQELSRHSTAEPAASSREFFGSEIAAAVKGTFTAIVERAVELVAHAHGLGALLTVAKWVWKAVTWCQVGEGSRGVDVEVPIPLGFGIELDLSARVGCSSGDAEPLVTFCFAPVSGPDPGVLVVDGCQISPGEAVHREPADEDREATSLIPEREVERAATRTAEDRVPVILVDLDLSRLMSKEPNPQIRTAALMYLAKRELIPGLKKRQLLDDLEAAGVEFVVYYDQDTKDSVWLLLSAVEARLVRTRIAFDAAGRLMLWRI